MNYDTRNRLPFYDPIPADYGFDQLTIKSAVCPLVMHDRWVFSQSEIPTGRKRRIEDTDGNSTLGVATTTKTDSRKLTFTCSRGRAEIRWDAKNRTFVWEAYDASGEHLGLGSSDDQSLCEEGAMEALGMLWAHVSVGDKCPTTTEPTNLPGVAV